MKLLEELVTTAGVPGREHRVRKLIRKHIDGLFDEVRTDTLGSLLCTRKPRPRNSDPRKGKRGKAGSRRSGATKVMIAAHMDQIGFLVSHVDDKGFVRLNPVGGFDTRNLFARLVTICPDPEDPKRDLPGVLNAAVKPTHIASEEDRKKVPQIGEFVVDLGLPGDEVQKKVKVGDMVVLRAALTEVGNTIVSQCLDNRVACWIAIRAIEQLEASGAGHDCEIHCVFTVQEEVGLRGAGTAAYAIEPDVGIALDTTLCCDTPGIPENDRITAQAQGAGLTVMDSASIADYELLTSFEAVAQKRKIKHQRSILTRGGTDAGAMQRTAAGIRTFTLSCPTRYIHTVTETIHRDDLNACRDLLAAWLEQA